MASALRVAEIQAKRHKAFGFVAWHGGRLRWLGALLARAVASHPLRLSATASMRFNQRFLKESDIDRDLGPEEILIRTEWPFINAGTKAFNYKAKEPKVFDKSS
jgi:hypothetical protein